MKNVFFGFVFVAFFAQSSLPKKKTPTTASPPNVQTLQKNQKPKKTTKRRAASEKRFVSKAEILGPDYDKDLDSAPIHASLSTHLSAIENLCHTKISLKKKIQMMEDKLQELRAFLTRYLREPYLSTDDQILLGDISDAVERKQISMGKPLTKAFNETDIEFAFTMAYRLNYNLPENTTVNQFAPWAKKIHKGFKCLSSMDKRNPASRKSSLKSRSKKSPPPGNKKASP